MHEPYKELKLYENDFKLELFLLENVLLHEPYKELKLCELQHVAAWQIPAHVGLHEPYKELKRAQIRTGVDLVVDNGDIA